MKGKRGIGGRSKQKKKCGLGSGDENVEGSVRVKGDDGGVVGI